MLCHIGDSPLGNTCTIRTKDKQISTGMPTNAIIA
jgi:hypothetical protein